MILEGKSLCSTDQKIIVSTENKRTHKGINQSSCVYHYKIDGDVISKEDRRLRCDYILENESLREVYIIELKGTDVEHAADQIESTLEIFNNKLKGYVIKPRIVYRSNTHGINSVRILRFKKMFPESILKTNRIEEIIG